MRCEDTDLMSGTECLVNIQYVEINILAKNLSFLQRIIHWNFLRFYAVIKPTLLAKGSAKQDKLTIT